VVVSRLLQALDESEIEYELFSMLTAFSLDAEGTHHARSSTIVSDRAVVDSICSTDPIRRTLETGSAAPHPATCT
jgi:hypothetical protein